MPELSPPSDPIARRGASTTTRDRLAQPARHRISLLGVLLLISALMMLDMARASGADPEFDFDVPPSPASKALVLFARQANIQLLFPYEAMSTVQLKGISGRYTAKDGIKALIAGTCLEATLSTETDSTLKISRQTRGFWFMRNDNCKPRKHKKVLSSVLAAGIGVSAGMAHGAEPVQPAVLDEIIVTAQKREERLQDVPIAITAINAEQLETRGVKSLAGLNGLAPNVIFRESPGQRLVSLVSIRGSMTSQPAIWVDPAVGLYMNGVYLGKSAGSVFDIVDIERVEVLRGPQGTLFGRNTEGGAINFVTRKPSGEFRGTAGIEVGNFKHRSRKLNVDLPRVGIASLSIGLLKEDKDGWAQNRTGPDLGATDTEAARTSLKLDFHDKFEALYDFDYASTENTPMASSLYSLNGWRGNFPSIFGPLVGTAIEDALTPYVATSRPSRVSTNHRSFQEKSRNTMHSITLNYQLSEQDELKYIFAKRKLYHTSTLDQDGSPLETITIVPGLTWRLEAGGARWTHYDQDSHELQWIGTRNRLRYVFGFYYFTDDGETHKALAFPLFGSPFQGADYASETHARAIFAQADYDVSDSWTATLGIRRTNEEKRGWSHRYLTSGYNGQPGSDTLPFIEYSKNFAATTPMAAISFKPNENVNFYVRIAKGFKSGGFSSEVADPRVTTPYDPQSSLSTEIGVKSSLLDGRARLNVALYNSEVSDLQTTQLLPGTTESLVVNAGEATYQGVELEAALQVMDGWRVQLTYGYLHAEFDKFIDNSFLPPLSPGGPVRPGGPLIDTANNRLPPYAPKHTINANIDARLLRTTWGDLRLILDATYTSKTHLYAVNKTLTDPHAGGANLVGIDTIPNLRNINARLLMAGIPTGPGTLDLSLWARNITDEDNPVQGIDFSMFRSVFWQEPRTYMITATYKW